MKEKAKAVFKGKFFKTVFSIFLLSYLFLKTDFSLVFLGFKEIRWFPFLIGVLLLPVSLLIRAYNWGLVLNREKKVFDFIELNQLNLVALGANLFLPASAGELVKAYYASKLRGEKTKMVFSVFIDKLTSLIAIFLIGSFFSYQEGFNYLAGFSFLFCFLSLLLLYIPTVFSLFFRFFSFDLPPEKGFNLKEILAFLVLPPGRLFLVLFVSLLGWLATYWQIYLFCQGFKVDLSFSYLLAISPALVLARLFPLALNGLGSGEAAFVYFFGLKGVDSKLAILVSLTSQLVNAFIPGLIGLAFFYRYPFRFSCFKSEKS